MQRKMAASGQRRLARYIREAGNNQLDLSNCSLPRAALRLPIEANAAIWGI
jgi:hypothetical protein